MIFGGPILVVVVTTAGGDLVGFKCWLWWLVVGVLNWWG